jgi:hypothetical protein
MMPGIFEFRLSLVPVPARCSFLNGEINPDAISLQLLDGQWLPSFFRLL